MQKNINNILIPISPSKRNGRVYATNSEFTLGNNWCNVAK